MQKNITISRKKDHIELAFEAAANGTDNRFYYEPLLNVQTDNLNTNFDICGNQMDAPIWVSSMTGGAEKAGFINKNLALACKEFGLGMGLGSCRILLESELYWEDFNLRKWIGNQPFFANLGIAQVEQLLDNKQADKINKLINKLKADGLIIHINPLQEALQPEGDIIKNKPLDTIHKAIQQIDYPIIIKEVGQGMGPGSLKELFAMPIEAIEFAAHGGTNFAKLELMRNDKNTAEELYPMIHIGHTAHEMVGFCNQIIKENPNLKTPKIIISGGIKTFIDGYYLTNKLNTPAIYGQASALLKKALLGEKELFNHIEMQLKGLRMAEAYLTIKA